MPAPVVCPTCREELDIPAAYRGRPVRCGACQATFTPPPDDAPAAPTISTAPPVPRRPEPADDPRQDFADDRGDRRDEAGYDRRAYQRGDRRPAPRKSYLWLWLTLAGATGVCCLGCVGSVALFTGVVDPDLVPYTAPDNSFTVSFPAPPTEVRVTPRPAIKPGRVDSGTGYEVSRTLLGAPNDTYFVYAYPLKAVPANQAAVDRLLQIAAADIAARSPRSRQVNSDPATTAGTAGLEVYVVHSPEDGTVARVFVAGEVLYVVGVTGRLLETPQGRERAAEFWDTFRLVGAKADPPAAGKEPAAGE